MIQTINTLCYLDKRSETEGRRKPTVSSSVMAAEHRVCDEKHDEHKTNSDGAEKLCRR